ncbi:MAG: hypothetical protein IAE79_11635 [Anaerolinea sp.]|nr:hypothetical protein [Anaerolinea sp.]
MFQAVPCPEYLSICDNDLGMSYSSRWYVINSDGSDLIPLKETDTFLADMWGVPRLSPDGMRLAYLARSQADEKLHLMLAEISSGSVTDLGPSPEVARELGFSSEPDCLLVYTTPRPEEAQEIQALTVTKVCAGSSTWEVLATIEFPTLPTMHTYLSDPLLSPNGDAFLITSRNTDDIRELYIYELGSPEPPRLLFAAENESWRINLIYWQSDGQHIEFFLQRWEVDDTVTILHYVSERNGANMRADLELTLPFSINGDWSPDHREIAFFSGMTVYTPAATGIYILDLETGVWRQILSGFYNDTSHIQSWQVDIP